ncbi:hypothetical protein [Actinoallomurus oryzae]|uniref:hypothetical protein n=1 Tax=Actinoallomurus oryzae TaxID=502180 RepID=UPI0031ED7A6E
MKHAEGQVWFFTNHQDIDVRNRDWFPGRQNNIRVLQALVPRLETRDLTVPEYRRILQDYAAGRISVRQVERMFPVPAPS